MWKETDAIGVNQASGIYKNPILMDVKVIILTPDAMIFSLIMLNKKQ